MAPSGHAGRVMGNRTSTRRHCFLRTSKNGCARTHLRKWAGISAFRGALESPSRLRRLAYPGGTLEGDQAVHKSGVSGQRDSCISVCRAGTDSSRQDLLRVRQYAGKAQTHCGQSGNGSVVLEPMVDRSSREFYYSVVTAFSDTNAKGPEIGTL